MHGQSVSISVPSAVGEAAEFLFYHCLAVFSHYYNKFT